MIGILGTGGIVQSGYGIIGRGGIVGAGDELPLIRSVAIVGGSTVDYNQVAGATYRYFVGQGFAVWAAAKLRQRFMLAYNASTTSYEFGTFGFTNAQIYATHIPQVITAAPDAALLYCGINDVGAGSSGSTVWNGILPMVTDLLAAGIKPIVMLIGPRLSTATGGSGYWARQVSSNAAIIAGCNSLGVQYFDPNPTWQNLTTGEPLPGVFVADGVHPSNYGASVLGDALADWMESNLNLGPSPFTATRIASLKGPNPTMTGGTTIATGYSGGGFGGTRTYSKVSDPEGDWQQLSHTGATRGPHYAGIYTSGAPIALPSGIAAGDYVRLWCEFEVDSPHASWLFNISRVDFGGTGLRQIAGMDGASGADAGASYEVLVPDSGVYVSPVIQVPSDATTYSLSSTITGGGVARWRNFGLEKVTGFQPPAIGS
jgi:lysophospholipase L1-like esterase